MFGDWFKVKEVDEFADSIVADLVKRFPPSQVESPGKKAAEKLRKTHDAIFRRIEIFGRTYSLNIYKKARLAARVREGMSALGYPEPFVKSFSFDLLARLQAASKQPGS